MQGADVATQSDELLHRLRDLELALQRESVRKNMEQIERLLHEDFAEIGRSGRRYDRADIVKLMLSQGAPGTVVSDDFRVVRLSDGTALLTYRSARMADDGSVSLVTHRSSIWQRTADGWKIRFHQGTPADASQQARPAA